MCHHIDEDTNWRTKSNDVNYNNVNYQDDDIFIVTFSQNSVKCVIF